MSECKNGPIILLYISTYLGRYENKNEWAVGTGERSAGNISSVLESGLLVKSGESSLVAENISRADCVGQRVGSTKISEGDITRDSYGECGSL